MIAAIPIAELSTDKPVPLDVADPCDSVPAGAVSPAGVATTPVESNEFGCVWKGPTLGLEIGALPASMTKEVEAHVAMANRNSTDPLAHLAWLRIDGHYAIERILEFDRAKGCWLTLDVSAPAAVHAVTYQIDPATGERAESDTDTSVRDLCPATRKIARNLLAHLESGERAWWATSVHPTR
ncbi:hypothetical protein [Actinophytocola sp.]|uniref:hypothetical protein n=1 Tax=Actinophytocola sp. TaxID=1872138 RepID=UPI002ED2DF24